MAVHSAQSAYEPVFSGQNVAITSLSILGGLLMFWDGARKGRNMGEIDWRYWATMAGVAIWVGIRDAEREPILRRLTKTAASALLAYGAGPSAAPYLGGSEIASAVALMAFGLLALDVASGLVGDRALIRDILRKRLGGGGNE